MAAVRLWCPACDARYRANTSQAASPRLCKKCGAELLPAGTTDLSKPISLRPLSQPDLDPQATTPVAASPAPLQDTKPDEVSSLWKPGDVILNLYEVKAVHEGGGMGLVYRVGHRRWNVDLALKSPRPEFFQNERHKHLFEREADTWVRLGLHPHVVSCYYVRRIDGIPRIFAEYVDGGSLSEWIRDRRLYAGGTDVALRRILDIAIQFAWGLQFAHERGLVHRDVKPGNVLLTSAGVAKVTDFGLAHAMAAVQRIGPAATARSGERRRSRAVSIGGLTPAYCSPEQVRRQPLSKKTDIWSWAVSVLEMFTGEISWLAGQVAGEALESYVEFGATDQRLPRMPASLIDLLRRCLHRAQDERPRDMRVVTAALLEAHAQVTGESYRRRLPYAAEASADSLNNRAVSLLDLGKQEEAEELWREALALEAQHPESTYNLGLARWRAGTLGDDGFVQQLRQTCASHAGEWLPLYLLALAHLEREDNEAALATLREIDPRDAGREEVQAALRKADLRLVDCLRPVRILEGYPPHLAPVETVCVSPDGCGALSGGWDHTLKIWDLASGRCLATLQGHRDRVTSGCVSADGRGVLSGSADQSLKFWDLGTGHCLRTMTGHLDQVSSVCLGANGKHALSGSWDLTLRHWDVATGSCLRTLEGHAGRLTAVAFCADHSQALSASGSDPDHRPPDNTLRRWDLTTGRCVRTYSGHADRVSALALSPDGLSAISASWDGTLRLWNLADGRCDAVLAGHAGPVTAVAFGPDGTWALSGGEDRTLKFWDLVRGRCLRTYTGHREAVSSLALTPDGSRAVTASRDRTPRVWRIDTERTSPAMLCRIMDSDKARRASKVYDRAIARARVAREEGNAAAAARQVRLARSQPGYGRREEGVQAWTGLYRRLGRKALNAAWEVGVLDGHRQSVTSVCFSPDAAFAVSASKDGTLKVWDVESSACIRTLKGHEDAVLSAALSADRRRVLSASRDGTARVWDVESGKCLQVLEGHDDTVASACMTSDGLFAVSSGWDENVRVWELAGGRCLRVLEGHEAEVSTVCLSADEQYILSGGWDRVLRLWNFASGECVRTFAAQRNAIASACFRADGRYALSGSFGKSCRMWDVTTGSRVRSMEGHTDRVSAMAFSADGRYALSGSWDKTLRLWKVPSGRCVRVFEGHTGKVNTVCLSADGRFALSGSSDRTLRLWLLDWELENHEPADWDDGARPYLDAFLTLHTPRAAQAPRFWSTNKKITQALSRSGRPEWSEDDFGDLLRILGCAGYGWLRPEGVLRELKRMASHLDT